MIHKNPVGITKTVTRRDFNFTYNSEFLIRNSEFIGFRILHSLTFTHGIPRTAAIFSIVAARCPMPRAK